MGFLLGMYLKPQLKTLALFIIYLSITEPFGYTDICGTLNKVSTRYGSIKYDMVELLNKMDLKPKLVRTCYRNKDTINRLSLNELEKQYTYK